MLKAISIILSGLVCFSLFLNTIIISNHVVNYDYIVSELCIEKDIKESCCKGSCHLADQFNKVENSKNSPELTFLNGSDLINWFSSEKIQETTSSNEDVSEKSNFTFQANILAGIKSRIFHPPIGRIK